MATALANPRYGAKGIHYPAAIMFGLVVIGTLIAVPTYAYFFDYTWIDWTLFGILYLFSGLGITVGYHRLITHRSFACPDWVKRILLIAGGWALQNSALVWGRDHIRHHARCDQEEDPYNAMRGFWFSHCGWLLMKDPNRNDKFATRLLQDPMVMWQHRNYVPIIVSGLILPFVVGFVANGLVGGIGCFLLAGAARTFFVLNSTFCINSVCHLWGNQPYGTQDSSRDCWWVSLVTFGEGYHNYHHTHQSDYRNGPLWYNFDPSKWLIYILSLFGLAYALRRGSPVQQTE